MAERRILDRPGGERQRKQSHEHDEGETAELAQAPAQRVAQEIGKAVQTVEAALDRRHGVLTPAPRRDDAAPAPSSRSPAPWRRGYSRGQDSIRPPARAPDSAPAPREGPPRARVSAAADPARRRERGEKQ